MERSALRPKPVARILFIHYLMATADNLVACHHLLEQFPNTELIGCICIFELERLNGKKKMIENGTNSVNYASLFTLDKLLLEKNLLNMVLKKKKEIIEKNNQ